MVLAITVGRVQLPGSEEIYTKIIPPVSRLIGAFFCLFFFWLTDYVSLQGAATGSKTKAAKQTKQKQRLTRLE